MNAPTILSCAEWHARSPQHAFERTRPRHVVIHHMATANRSLESNPAAAREIACQLARSCQDDHMDVNGWADTGQSFTVSRDGVVLEGRHGSLSAAQAGQAVRGAHAADGAIDYNDDYGIENEGRYDSVAMPDGQWKALVSLVGWLCHQAGIDTADVIGHRNTGISTACPGDWLDGQLPRLRKEARAIKLALAGEKPS